MKKEWRGLAVRLPKETVARFDERAQLFTMNRSEMMRYLIDAFVEGRLSVRRSVEATKADEDLHQ